MQIWSRLLNVIAWIWLILVFVGQFGQLIFGNNMTLEDMLRTFPFLVFPSILVIYIIRRRKKLSEKNEIPQE